MRLFILLLCMFCVGAFGYALAGYGGSLVGKGRPDYIAWGLGVGVLCGATAIVLWKKWLKTMDEENAGKTGGERDETE
jgi:hypothetical protein